MDYSAKLTWLFIIMLMPVPGTILLWYTRADIGHRAIKFRIAQLVNETKHMLYSKEEVLNNEELIDDGVIRLNQYLNRSGCFPIYQNTDVTYFPSGEAKFKQLLEEIEAAKEFIFLEYFLVEEGYMWGNVLSRLIKKAEEGVEVRVIYDGMCEVMLLPFNYHQKLKKCGIKSKAFLPIHPLFSTYYNYRDHRKICVIDGKVAFNGGINLADEYINKKKLYGHWKDTAVMLKGEAVNSFTLMFLQMWNIDERNVEWDKYLRSTFSNATSQNDLSKGFVMPFADCPLDNDKVGENVYMDILYSARQYVHICTPYLILDNEIETALKYAACRGIDVKIILPGIPDKKIAYSLATTQYKSLLLAGVKIYEYTPGFVHAKSFVSDDLIATVGTINLDYRSLYHHFECATYMYNTPCIKDIEDDFIETLGKCREVTLESLKKGKISYKVIGSLAKAIAPLM